jgi:3-oxoacyl-[acyl-carrier-protein] synthase II
VTVPPSDAVAVTGTAMVTCLGDAGETLAALRSGETGVAPLSTMDSEALRVTHCYPIQDGEETQLRPGQWLAAVVAEAAANAGLDPAAKRVAVVVGSGLRELRSVERWHADGAELSLPDLHFDAAVRAVLPDVTEVLTISNACSAGGYALAVGMDLLAADEADAVIVAGTDTMTESMLAMIGRVGDEPTTHVAPFDTDRGGVLLGDGAVAVVIEPDGAEPLARIRSVGLSCDAFHETAPDRDGIAAAMRDAHGRAGLGPGDVGLVLAHGTGTALNDPTEAAALTEVFGTHTPPVTGIKGAVGHTSGGAALMSLVVAVDALRAGVVPAVTGLSAPIDEAAALEFVLGASAPLRARIAQVDAFGFGGVNAVTMVEV